jgi:hypothetical protein
MKIDENIIYFDEIIFVGITRGFAVVEYIRRIV